MQYKILTYTSLMALDTLQSFCFTHIHTINKLQVYLTNNVVFLDMASNALARLSLHTYSTCTYLL